MPPSNWTITEQAHCVEPGELRAVIYSSDRFWTRAVVYGPPEVVEAVKGQKPGTPTTVEQKHTSKLGEIPRGTVRKASDYGLKNGKVLLVLGNPPDAN